MTLHPLLALATLVGAATAAQAAQAAQAATPMAPHRAVYDLALSSQEGGISGAEGRIAMSISSKVCGDWNLDYRFVARFQQEQEITLTDQQTTSAETGNGAAFTFTTKTFVDGSPEKEVRGAARNDAGATRVSMEAPERKEFQLPLSRFPMQHTRELIQRALAGERIVETKLFDGDDDAEKLLTSTAVITPVDAAAAAASAGVGDKLKGMRSWRVSESYYNSDSDPDGMPVFQTSYELYENGVSDDLVLNFGTYSFSGSLKQLDLLDVPACN